MGAYLSDYKHPKDARSDSQKFEGMYRRFSEVYSDMEKVGSLSLLQHPASIQEFMKILPAPCMEKYIVFRLTELDKGTLDLEIVKRFMQTERKHQKEMQQLRGEGSGGVLTGHSTATHQTPHPSRDKTKDQCRNCQKYGHHAKECTKKKPASKSHSGQQVSAQNKEFCPFCKKKGKNEAHEYRPGQVQQGYHPVNSSETQVQRKELLSWTRSRDVPSVYAGRVTLELTIALLQQRVSRLSPVRRMGVARNIIGSSTGHRTPM